METFSSLVIQFAAIFSLVALTGGFARLALDFFRGI